MENTEMARRNQKYDYLLSRPSICGTWGAKMHAAGRQTLSKGPTLCYHCPVPTTPRGYAKEYDQRKYFRADEVEPDVWNWIKDLVGNPDTIEEIPSERHKYQEEANRPVLERLRLVQDGLDETNSQMDRRVGLYLTGQFSPDALSKHRMELEDGICDLKRQRSELEEQLNEDTVNEDQIESLKASARGISICLEEADDDFETRRRIIDLLDVMVTLGVEDGKTIIEAECRIGAGAVPIPSRSTGRWPT